MRPATLTLSLALIGCNAAPTAPQVTLTPEAPGTLDALVAQVDGATDPNDDAVTLLPRWTRDGEPARDQDGSFTVPAGKTRKGEVWRVTVTASDGKASSPSASAEVTVVNTPPTATLDITPAAPRTTDRIRATSTTTDVDQDPVSVRYQWTLNGSVNSNTSPDLPASATAKGDVWELAVFPSDNEGEAEPTVRTVTIANTPPVVADATVNPSVPDKYDTLSCRGTGWQDQDGDPEGYDVAWQVNGVQVSTEASLAGSTLSRGDSVRCVLTPNDSDDTGPAVTSKAVVMGNTAPRITDVVITPDEPLKDDVVTATIEGANDPDGDTVTYRYQWFVGGEASGTTATLASSRFLRGDRIRLEVTPFDGTAEGDKVVSNTVVGGNNLPTIELLTLVPDDLYTDDVLEAQVISSDPDGDTVTAVPTWKVNGTVITASELELDGLTWFDKGDTVEVSVVPNDGVDDGAVVASKVLTVRNSTPTVPELVFSPAEPVEGDTIVCVIDEPSVDADGDALTYTFRWQNNGMAVTGTTTTYANDTVSGSQWTEGDDLRCTVTASDGTAVSAPGSMALMYGSKDNPGLSCDDILTERPDYESGAYWVDPDGDGSGPSYEVWCDMETEGGGWMLTYFVDAEHFDGWEANDSTADSEPPSEINEVGTIWDTPSTFKPTESIFGCTTQNDAATHYWRYSNTSLADSYAGSGYVGYVYTASNSSSTTRSSCAAAYKAPTYGYFALNSSSCSTAQILWGMWHYNSSAGYNSTDTTYGTHTSKYRSRAIHYPICGGKQTSNGSFWIGVR